MAEIKEQETPIREPRHLSEVLGDLAQPIPARFLKDKRKGGTDITFVSWYDLQRMLEYNTAGFWENEVTKIHSTERHVFVTVRISITTQEGRFSRESTGSEELEAGGWGENLANAEAQAFRRTCAKWGLGLELWLKD